jgi:hypothetical protein
MELRILPALLYRQPSLKAVSLDDINLTLVKYRELVDENCLTDHFRNG